MIEVGGMAQISVQVSDQEFELLAELADSSGRSNSSLAAEFIRQGLYREVENRTKVEVYRKMISTEKTQSPKKT